MYLCGFELLWEITLIKQVWIMGGIPRMKDYLANV